MNLFAQVSGRLLDRLLPTATVAVAVHEESPTVAAGPWAHIGERVLNSMPVAEPVAEPACCQQTRWCVIDPNDGWCATCRAWQDRGQDRSDRD